MLLSNNGRCLRWRRNLLWQWLHADRGRVLLSYSYGGRELLRRWSILLWIDELHAQRVELLRKRNLLLRGNDLHILRVQLSLWSECPIGRRVLTTMRATYGDVPERVEILK